MKKILSVLTAGIVLAGSLLVASCKLEESDTIANLIADQVNALGSVANLKAETSYGSVLLTWDKVDNALNYRIVRYDSENKGTTLEVAVRNNQYTDGTTTKYWYADTNVPAAGKYTYGVTALANNGLDTVKAARALYFTDSFEARSAEVEVAFTAADAALVADVTVADKGERWNGWDIKFPAVAYATVDYKYAVASYTQVAELTEDVFTDNGSWVELKDNYNTTSNGSSDVWTPSSTKIQAWSNNTVAGTLLVAVRAKKHTSEKWTIVNTGKTVLPTNNEGALVIDSNVVNASNANRKYELYIKDTFSNGIESTVNGNATASYKVVDSPANYTYVLKGYKVTYDPAIFEFVIPSTPTVTKELTLNAVDGAVSSGSKTWGTEYVTGELKDEDCYYYVVVRTHKVKGTVKTANITLTGYTYTTSYANDLTYNLSFNYTTSTSAVATSPATGYNYTYLFSYIIGNDYTDAKVYRASKSSWQAAPTITSEFKEYGMTDTAATLSTWQKNGSIGSKSFVVNIPATQTVTNNNSYVYALVAKSKTTGAYHVVYTSATVIE